MAGFLFLARPVYPRNPCRRNGLMRLLYGMTPAINAATNANAAQIMRTFKDRVSPIGLSPSYAPDKRPVRAGRDWNLSAKSREQKKISCCNLA